jgi:hypothetical protein
MTIEQNMATKHTQNIAAVRFLTDCAYCIKSVIEQNNAIKKNIKSTSMHCKHKENGLISD